MSDLISREALKKDIMAYKTMPEIRKAICEVIDNAPTVEPYTKDDMTREYLKGYNACKDMNERPQGEWLWLGDNPNPNHKWSCNKCGRGVKEQENFCPNCGADMRKGGAV